MSAGTSADSVTPRRTSAGGNFDVDLLSLTEASAPEPVERAAMVAGMDRTDFLMALGREQVDAFHVDLDQLAREIGGE